MRNGGGYEWNKIGYGLGMTLFLNSFIYLKFSVIEQTLANRQRENKSKGNKCFIFHGRYWLKSINQVLYIYMYENINYYNNLKNEKSMIIQEVVKRKLCITLYISLFCLDSSPICIYYNLT